MTKKLKFPPYDQSKNIMYAPHLVILGAGASKASCPEGDSNSKRLPLMDPDFVRIVGLEEILKRNEINYHGIGFETLFSSLYQQPDKNTLCKEIESEIFNYFSELCLPEEVTIYDLLISSLRSKDVVATFNWDPFLLQAYRRNGYIGSENMPKILFLHGNVGIGTCSRDEHKTVGALGGACSKCGQLFNKVDLLYPIEKKDYNQTQFLQNEWNSFKNALNTAYLITIFGYGAPKSDVEAINMMLEMTEKNEWRDFYEVELIDLKNKKELIETWDKFIVEHHYRTINNFADSLMYKYPRRSCESFAKLTLMCEQPTQNVLSTINTFEDLKRHVKPLVWEERSSSNNGLSNEKSEVIYKKFESFDE